jgi:hypothetical protein
MDGGGKENSSAAVLYVHGDFAAIKNDVVGQKKPMAIKA